MTEFNITHLGHHGNGITEDGYYAPLTLPGEVIRGIQSAKSLEEVKIIEPSSDRVRPICSHFKTCGGCQLQHASDEFVSSWKVAIVAKALAIHGISTELRTCLTSPIASRRRATFSARRTKKGAMAGFHARGSDVIVEIANCQLLDADLVAALPIVEAFAVIGTSRKGELSAHVTTSQAGLDIAIEGGKLLDGPMRASLAQKTEAHHLARLSWNKEVIAMRHAPSQKFGAATVVPPPGSFLQATKEGQEDLLKTVKTILTGAKRIVDLFSGCGTFSLSLAETAEVHAVEANKDMMAALDKGWRQTDGLKKVTHEARNLFLHPLLPNELVKFDAVIIDPPRAGADAQVATLCKSNIKMIAYVSCNPVSFARDAALLVANGYDLQFVQTVDQFRWSSHIELVGGFFKA
jgi:23S rRNA (uracil1939-C5)-methyltransferase